MASSPTYAFFHCHYAFQKFPFFCVTLCVLHALQNATESKSFVARQGKYTSNHYCCGNNWNYNNSSVSWRRNMECFNHSVEAYNPYFHSFNWMIKTFHVPTSAYRRVIIISIISTTVVVIRALTLSCNERLWLLFQHCYFTLQYTFE